MNIIKKIVSSLKKFWNTPINNQNKNPTKNTINYNENLNFQKNNAHISLKDLEKTGLLTVEQDIDKKKVSKENLIYASQLPAHIFPWVIGMKSGIHLIKFSPTIQSQINSGFFNVTGGVARNQSGQIMAHGVSTSLLSLSPIILYQIGTIAFGTYHLKKINKSLEKINKKLDEISSFLLEKRSSEIIGLSLELSHISKGIIEFKKLGNLTEVFARVDLIKNIRVMNLPNLIHLQKNLQNKLNNLKNLERTSLFGSEAENKDLMDSIDAYDTVLVDYSRSLLLDIICTEIEVSFSKFSAEEVKSRLKFQNNQTKFLKSRSSAFKSTLYEKMSELIDSSVNKDKTKAERRKNIKSSWKKIEKRIPGLYNLYKKHLLSIENKINSKSNTIFLQIDSHGYKKSD